MERYPVPYRYGEWPSDCAEDYLRAKSDDERRKILLDFGYDLAHLPKSAVCSTDLRANLHRPLRFLTPWRSIFLSTPIRKPPESW